MTGTNKDWEFEPARGAQCSVCNSILDPSTVSGVVERPTCQECGLAFDGRERSIAVPFDDVSIAEPIPDTNGDGTTTIATCMRGDEIAETADVDAEWLAESRRAREANEIATNRLLWLPGIVGIGVGNADHGISDGLRGPSRVRDDPRGLRGVDRTPRENRRYTTEDRGRWTGRRNLISNGQRRECDELAHDIVGRAP